MAGQQQQIFDTIFAMKKRLMRDEDSSDGDESDTPYNHRQQSLKRKAKYTRAGKPEFPTDPAPYKKRIRHAGYTRYILHRNPPKYDPDGDIIAPNDEYEDEDELSPVEEDPYTDIKLEELLAPLTSAADLPGHPSYSQAYTSKHLTNLTSEAGAISRKEQVTLARAKRLFTRLCGDPMFVPLSIDNLHYGEDLQDPWVDPASPQTATRQTNGENDNDASEAHENGDTQDPSNGPDCAMHDTDHPDEAHDVPRPTTEDADLPDGINPDESTATVNGNAEHIQGSEAQQDGQPQPNGNGNGNGERHASAPPSEAADSPAQELQQHRMTTRGRAQALAAPDLRSPTIPAIHPLFTFPTAGVPDADMGLPAAEAEHTRVLLHTFIRTQEEIARTTSDLFLGLQQSERMRHEVFTWCKAEGHVGEMSDGEDWYDKEWWGLTEDLVKGKDEEEEESQVQGKKSTRQRRTKDKNNDDR